jgi:hypothetical protein
MQIPSGIDPTRIASHRIEQGSFRAAPFFCLAFLSRFRDLRMCDSACNSYRLGTLFYCRK